VVTHQLQVERRTAKGHRPRTDALPLDYATNGAQERRSPAFPFTLTTDVDGVLPAAGAGGSSRSQGQRALLHVLPAVPRLVGVPHELQRGEAVGLRRVRATEERGGTAQQQDALQEHAQGDSSTRGHVQRRLAGRLRHPGTSVSVTTTTPPRPFHGPFSGTTRVSWCQKRTSGLYGARGD